MESSSSLDSDIVSRFPITDRLTIKSVNLSFACPVNGSRLSSRPMLGMTGQANASSVSRYSLATRMDRQKQRYLEIRL